MTITPIAFLTVSPNAEVGIIPISSADNDIDKLVRLVDRSPDIISKIKGILS
jgi:uncharacterized spore protein YtfJ